jgi:hypothetical protein
MLQLYKTKGFTLMKIAVCFIGTSSYINFFPEYYRSCEKYLLPGHEKLYLVFTDQPMLTTDNVKVFPIVHKKYPYITLERWHALNMAREQIKDCDALFYIDADAKPVDTITPEDLFVPGKPYIGVHHSLHYLGLITEYPGSFDVNPQSHACVTPDMDSSIYYQGCVWGCAVPEIFHMLDTLQSRTDDDASRNVMAVWFDESHLNKFLIERKHQVHTLGPSYCYPEPDSARCNFPAKILHQGKDNNYFHNL